MKGRYSDGYSKNEQETNLGKCRTGFRKDFRLSIILLDYLLEPKLSLMLE